MTHIPNQNPEICSRLIKALCQGSTAGGPERAPRCQRLARACASAAQLRAAANSRGGIHAPRSWRVARRPRRRGAARAHLAEARSRFLRRARAAASVARATSGDTPPPSCAPSPSLERPGEGGAGGGGSGASPAAWKESCRLTETAGGMAAASACLRAIAMQWPTGNRRRAGAPTSGEYAPAAVGNSLPRARGVHDRSSSSDHFEHEIMNKAAAEAYLLTVCVSLVRIQAS